MKIQRPSSDSNRIVPAKRIRAFTLPEILIALTVFLFVIAGIIAANLFGLKMFQTNQTKLNATAWSRNVFGKIGNQIRSCNSFSILNVTTNGLFQGLLPGEPQQGNAIEIQPDANTNDAIYYFVDSLDETFRQMDVTSAGTNTLILADSVTNAIVFSAQDFSGDILTNSDDRLVHIVLEFYQPGSAVQDPYYYKLETGITRRALQ